MFLLTYWYSDEPSKRYYLFVPTEKDGHDQAARIMTGMQDEDKSNRTLCYDLASIDSAHPLQDLPPRLSAP